MPDIIGDAMLFEKSSPGEALQAISQSGWPAVVLALIVAGVWIVLVALTLVGFTSRLVLGWQAWAMIGMLCGLAASAMALPFPYAPVTTVKVIGLLVGTAVGWTVCSAAIGLITIRRRARSEARRRLREDMADSGDRSGV